MPHRLFVLGAGFSHQAGIPLANDLLNLVLDEIAAQSPDGDSHLHRSLEDYRDYLEAVTGDRPEAVDIENFTAFLDHQHAFGMLGSDTWSKEGNRDQFLLRWGIGRTLWTRLPAPQDLPGIYLDFASQLNPGDVIVTFNYDLVLERSLNSVGLPFRRFPTRFSEIGKSQSTVDSDAEASEVLILKPHGSLDWVSRRSYDRHVEYMRDILGEDGANFAKRRDSLFGEEGCSSTHPLVEGPRPNDDPLEAVSIVEDLDSYYGSYQTAFFHPPMILAPSESKQLYGAELRNVWNGLSTFSWGWAGFSIIGYSLPHADPYTRQILYRISKGYVTGLEDPKWRIGPMNPIVVIDRRETKAATKELKDNYRFLPPEHTTYALDGFSNETLDLLKPKTAASNS